MRRKYLEAITATLTSELFRTVKPPHWLVEVVHQRAHFRRNMAAEHRVVGLRLLRGLGLLRLLLLRHQNRSLNSQAVHLLLIQRILERLQRLEAQRALLVVLDAVLIE